MLRPSDIQNVRELLLAIRHELVTNGWQQNAYGRGDQPKCLEGASFAVGATARQRNLVEEVLVAQIKRNYPREHHMNIVSWNDQPGRKVEDVLFLIDSALTELETEGLSE